MSHEKTPEHEEALSMVQAFAGHYTELATRHRRTLVQTRHGLRSGDRELREQHEQNEEIMNTLLDGLLEHRGAFEPEPLETVEEIKAAITPEVGRLTVFRVQMIDEPIPEGFSGGLVQINPYGGNHERKW